MCYQSGEYLLMLSYVAAGWALSTPICSNNPMKATSVMIPAANKNWTLFICNL